LQEFYPSDAERALLLAHLDKPAALARMERMGKGVTLVSHENTRCA